MRHNKKFNHLTRTAAHRKAMLSNMAVSLLTHKRIFTTLPKAKALRMYVEPILTRAKEDTVHARRMAYRKLQNHQVVAMLFGEIAQKIGDRPGGYTRILKTGHREGDAAMMCFIELVDFNEDRVKAEKKSGTGKRTRRSRRSKARTATDGATTQSNHKADNRQEAVETQPIQDDAKVSDSKSDNVVESTSEDSQSAE